MNGHRAVLASDGLTPPAGAARKASKVIRIALAGNPNTGKTTLFNAMTGSHQKVGNYAGVTVEKREGRRLYKGYEFQVHDLPGVYSLTAYSMDEVVARDFIINERPDVVIDVIDSTNIERNLYLCLQFQELNVPIVAALNLNDEAISRGIQIDEKRLSEILRMPVIKTVGKKSVGVEQILDKAIVVFEQKEKPAYEVSYGYELEEDVQAVIAELKKDDVFCLRYPVRWCAVKLIEKDARADELVGMHTAAASVRAVLKERVKRIEEHFGRDSSIVVSEQRYGYIHGAAAEAVTRLHSDKKTITEKVDQILMDRVLGFPVFLFILWSIFQITFKIGAYPMGWIESLFGWLSSLATSVIPAGILRSLLVDGVIAGVGGVSSFIPLIILLFMFISILEDSGYMSRAAFIMDKFLHIFGLHGQSFLPMILGIGCSVPAVMAARTLKNMRDRVITVMVTPFMSCGAKLPVYVLLAGAFFPKHAGTVVLSMYVVGATLALFSSLLFRKTVLRGESTPFVMELPPYRLPTVKGILWHVREKTFGYLKKAGLVLLPASMLIWAVTTFPKSAGDAPKDVAMAQSYAGQIGRGMAPVLAPIGFDWKIGIAAVTGFAAKEMVVSTLGVLYRVEARADEKSDSLRSALRRDPTFSPLVAYVLMLFMLIVVPCFASVSVIYSEIGFKWVMFAITYWTVLAWSLCFVVYHSGRLLGF
ncbi:MAG: ferrous iron transport protein B [Candidatus Omnitrophica bacterium]|nr:ferrous iron transport protein B [Candidatus Omnitrophota bacterium]